MQTELANKNQFNVIGLMSGTSLDGLDVAAVELVRENDIWKFEIKKAVTIDYPNDLEEKLRNAPELNGEELTRLHFQYGKYLGEQVNEFISNSNFAPDLIASHGHTVFHRPEEGITLQIGSGEAIARLCGVLTVADFRTGDVLLGGQGAPLVPIGDRLLFSDYDYCLNLGGFANISFESSGERLAYDVCPVNIVLNAIAQKLGKKYDKDGELGRSGTIDTDLLDQLNSLSFYKMDAPKSLGREWVEAHIDALLDAASISDKDKLRTYYEHIAIQLAVAVKGSGSMLVTGGGAFNSFLMERIKAHASVELVQPSKEIIDFKEALIFAFLGVLRVMGETNCLASVTGARCNSSSGVIYLP